MAAAATPAGAAWPAAAAPESDWQDGTFVAAAAAALPSSSSSSSSSPASPSAAASSSSAASSASPAPPATVSRAERAAELRKKRVLQQGANRLRQVSGAKGNDDDASSPSSASASPGMRTATAPVRRRGRRRMPAFLRKAHALTPKTPEAIAAEAAAAAATAAATSVAAPAAGAAGAPADGASKTATPSSTPTPKATPTPTLKASTVDPSMSFSAQLRKRSARKAAESGGTSSSQDTLPDDLWENPTAAAHTPRAALWRPSTWQPRHLNRAERACRTFVVLLAGAWFAMDLVHTTQRLAAAELADVNSVGGVDHVDDMNVGGGAGEYFDAREEYAEERLGVGGGGGGGGGDGGEDDLAEAQGAGGRLLMRAMSEETSTNYVAALVFLVCCMSTVAFATLRVTLFPFSLTRAGSDVPEAQLLQAASEVVKTLRGVPGAKSGFSLVWQVLSAVRAFFDDVCVFVLGLVLALAACQQFGGVA